MNCEQVLGIIDARHLAECTPYQIQEVERHTESCVQCRGAQTIATTLDSELKRLPEPSPPAGLADAIMQRTTSRAEDRAAAPAVVATPSPEKAATGWPVWSTALVGVVIAGGVQVNWLIGGDSTLRLSLPPAERGINALVQMPPAGPAVLVLMAGLLLYLLSIFAAAGNHEQPGEGQ